MLVGKEVAQYRILQPLGAGGMGEVFLAEDSILHRRVALKFLHAGTGEAASRGVLTDEAKRRILDEARAAAAIDHPYVCKIFGTGEFEGQPFIAMEFVAGETLQCRLSSGPMALHEVLPLAIEIAEALAAAHAKGMVHCDLKPQNIMLMSGHVKLMDFGLARTAAGVVLSTDDATLTIPLDPQMGGTIPYMSPEQVRSKGIDARTDVFALGIILFEMLTGGNPFRRKTTPATVAAILAEDPPAIEQLVSDVPAGLKDILGRALARDHDARYESAREFALDLIALRDGTKVAESAPKLPAIAILPFRDLSSERDQEYFCDGLAEELIVALSRLEQLRVVSRSASFRYRNQEGELKETGKTLGASLILEGSVRKAGGRLRIVVNLVDVGTGFPVWFEKYDREANDIFEIQDEISQAIAGKFRDTSHVHPVSRPSSGGTSSVRAYELYLKGRYLWNKRTEDNVRSAIDYFQQAIAEDPAYAPAWAGVAEAWTTLSLYGAVRPIDAMPSAAKAAERARSLRPDQPEAHLARACIRAVFDWDWQGAEQDFREALRLNPRYAQAHQWFAMNCLIPRGLFDQAEDELKLAAEIEPESRAIATSLGVLDLFRGNAITAMRRFRAVLEPDENFYLAHYFLGQACLEGGMHDEAIRELRRAVDVSAGSSESLSALAYAHAGAGNEAEALRILEQLRDKALNSYVSPVLLAQVHLGLDRFDEAFACLESALKVRAADVIWLKVRPAFARIRSHEKLAPILAACGLGPQSVHTGTAVNTGA